MGWISTGLALVSLTAAAESAASLERSCKAITRTHLDLMMVVMLEGPVECGDPDSGISVDCDANDTAEQKLKRAKRLEIRKQQEAAFGTASEACAAFLADRGSGTRREAAVRAIAGAQEIGTKIPAGLEDRREN